MTSSEDLAQGLATAAEIGLKQVPRAPDGREIITDYINPPIPISGFQWMANLEDYDGSEPGAHPIGYGRTEAEAIADLLEQIEGEISR
jgi:hypothetical protein